jgi:hypothetical protein
VSSADVTRQTNTDKGVSLQGLQATAPERFPDSERVQTVWLEPVLLDSIITYFAAFRYKSGWLCSAERLAQREANEPQWQVDSSPQRQREPETEQLPVLDHSACWHLVTMP